MTGTARPPADVRTPLVESRIADQAIVPDPAEYAVVRDMMHPHPPR